MTTWAERAERREDFERDNRSIKPAKKKHGGKRHNQTGRPPLPEAQRLQRRWVSMTPAQWLHVENLARRSGCTASEYIRRLF
jgi:hypothetical protein